MSSFVTSPGCSFAQYASEDILKASPFAAVPSKDIFPVTEADPMAPAADAAEGADVVAVPGCLDGAEEGPFFGPGPLDSAGAVLLRRLLPLVASREAPSPAGFDFDARRVRGNRMAKGAVEAALRDLEAKARGVSLSSSIGGTRDVV